MNHLDLTRVILWTLSCYQLCMSGFWWLPSLLSSSQYTRRMPLLSPRERCLLVESVFQVYLSHRKKKHKSTSFLGVSTEGSRSRRDRNPSGQHIRRCNSGQGLSGKKKCLSRLNGQQNSGEHETQPCCCYVVSCRRTGVSWWTCIYRIHPDYCEQKMWLLRCTFSNHVF